MDLMKTGSLLRELRKEKEMTQEQLAEKLNVARRTVSRWETGSNMPDLDVLIELADFYNVDIREIIDGERKQVNMDTETMDTLKKVADYAEEERKLLARRMWDLTAAGCVMFWTFMFLYTTGLSETGSWGNLADFALGLTGASMVLNLMYCSGRLERIRAWKLKLFREMKSRKKG